MTNDADEAERALQDVVALTGRTRRSSRSMSTGLPLVGWGFAWIVGLGALDLLDGALRVVVVTLAWVIGMLLSWFPPHSRIKTGFEARMRWSWVAVLVSSPFFVGAAQAGSFQHAVLLLGALWGLAMTLFAIATGDRVLAVAAGVGVVAAGLLGYFENPIRLVWFGLCAGIPLLAVGVWRFVVEVRDA